MEKIENASLMETHSAVHVNEALWILKDYVKVRESLFGLTQPAETCPKFSLKLSSQMRRRVCCIFKLLVILNSKYSGVVV